MVDIKTVTMPTEQVELYACLFHHYTYDSGNHESSKENELFSDLDDKISYDDNSFDEAASINANTRFFTEKASFPGIDAIVSFQRKKKPRSGVIIDNLVKALPSFDNITMPSESDDGGIRRLVSLMQIIAAETDIRHVSRKEDDGCLIPGLEDDVAHLCLARLPRSDYRQYSTVSKKFCSFFRSRNLYRTRRRLGVFDQWLYVLNSSRVWRAYDPKDGRWRRLPHTPSDYAFEMSDKESLTAGTQLLVRGFQIEGNVIWIYDAITNEWFKGSDMRTPRYLYGSASAGVFGFVAGGVDYSQNLLKSSERYNSLIGRWEPLPDMNKRRKLCSGFYMDDKFYVIGGVNEHGRLTCGEEYDPATRSWKHIPDMFPMGSDQSLLAPPLVAVVDNRLYAFEASDNLLRAYDKASNSWRELGGMPVRADVSNGWGVAFKALEGQLVVIGSHRGHYHTEDDDDDGADADAVWAWQPPSAEGSVPEWYLMTRLVPSGSFIFNCAVMTA